MDANSELPSSDPGPDVSESQPESAAVEPQAAASYVAKAGTYYRTTHLLMGVLLIGFGAWCAMDGFKNWPNANDQADKLDRQLAQLRAEKNDTTSHFADLLHQREAIKVHGGWDLLIQRTLAIALPLGGLGMLIWTLYNSRGAYRLDGEVLSIPGHPQMKLSEITAVNRLRWERKGIAVVEYMVDGARGSFRLDDFLYERNATDAIYDRIVERLSAPGDTPEAKTEAGAADEQT